MMTITPVYKVNWEHAFGDSYNYGSEIKFLEHNVEFSNPLMPPNLAIMTWYSKRAFSSDRAFPTLPILRHGHEYAVKMDYAVTPANGVYWMIRFYGADDQQIEHANFDDLDGTFIYPDAATHYEISIMNIGHEKLVFKNLLLMDETLASATKIAVNNEFGFISVKPNLSTNKRLKVIFLQTNTATEVYQVNNGDETQLFWNLTLADFDNSEQLLMLQGIKAWWHNALADDEQSFTLLEQLDFENQSSFATVGIQRLLRTQIDNVLKLEKPAGLQRELYQMAISLHKNPWIEKQTKVGQTSH